ncbi:lysophospholipid acyltransferase family protein [Hippea jasoniae]|uniref:lysophospholipid acyltransferase family protein n=1 Tax=Hippea jasoniae TaxID=944479 RepID=UPI00068F04D7|nr:lysophospholipid acyltransferase family protein [Hippea jasoniae]
MEIEKIIETLKLSQTPYGQIVVGHLFLRPIYFFSKLNIVIEGIENIPDQPVIFAMNHTDRYNYWPFQFKLWRIHKKYNIKYPYITTWVKGKYYENKWLARFMSLTNNIPIPSKGYLLAKDLKEFFKERYPLKKEEFLLLKRYIDGALSLDELIKKNIDKINKIISTKHDNFNPENESYRDYINNLFRRVMKSVYKLNYQAIYEKNLNITIFPEGTRSKTLTYPKPGLAQIALALKVPVVPIGCSGSDKAHPGNAPVPIKNSTITYRIGKPIKLHEVYKLNEEFEPFVSYPEEYKKIFEEAMQLVMSKIARLVDKEYIGDFTKKNQTDLENFV